MQANLDGIKYCPKCKFTKQIIEFNKCKTEKDNLCCWCKICSRKSQERWAKNRNNKNIDISTIDLILDEKYINNFWAKIVIKSENECWEWIGSKNTRGYGNFSFRTKFISAHRFSFLLHNLYLPKDLEIMHVCDNRCCVNPKHLVKGTHSDNMQDMVKKNRHMAIIKPEKIFRGEKYSAMRKITSRGSRNSMAKLNEEIVLKIRKEYLINPKTHEEIAKNYNVLRHTITDVLNYKTWKHVQLDDLEGARSECPMTNALTTPPTVNNSSLLILTP